MTVLNCQIVTPEKTALEQKVDFVALPLFDGEIGIAPGRAPMIGRLGYGEMRIRTGQTVTRYYIDGGFVQVAGEVVSVLTNRAIPSQDVDGEAARKHLLQALERPISTPELEEQRNRALAQARAQIWVSRSHRS
jgi:F-type H+-transporting ATPase subunit epsilon